MGGDPLSFFASEKTASDDRPKKLDPGERALAGMAAASTFAMKAVPEIGSFGLGYLAEKGSVSSRQLPQLRGLTTLDPKKINIPSVDKSRFMGLFNVSTRDKTPEGLAEATAKLDDIHGVVDSFFKKNNLAEKGVRIDIRNGPLSSSSGNQYDILNKRVRLTDVSKEIALHELGHAADFTGSRFARMRGLASGALLNIASTAVPIALVAGDEISKAIPGTVDDKAIRFMQEYAPEIAGATLAATQLYPEAKASFLALKHIKEVEGSLAAKEALKKLLPAWGTYALAAIPPIVGMALARKYWREAHEHNASHSKTASVGDLVSGFAESIANAAHDIGHVGSQIAHGVQGILSRPGAGARFLSAAKEVGSSPQFVYGAMSSAIPAAAGAMYLYGTPQGKVMRNRMGGLGEKSSQVYSRLEHKPQDETWREQNPAAFAGIVGLGTALSAGVLSKLFHDLTEVL